MRHLTPLLAVLGALSVSAQTQIDLRTQTKNVDFTGAPYTRPVKAGTSLPSTCSTGDLFLNTSGVSPVLYACLSGVWGTAQNGASVAPITVENAGATVGARNAENFITAPGILNVLSDDGREINIQTGVDTSTVVTFSANQSGSALFCQPSAANSVNYSCSMTPTLTAYARGMTVNWSPDVTCTPGALTLNIDTLGAVPIKQQDGLTNLSSCIAGSILTLAYDGSVFRAVSGTPSTSTTVDPTVFLSRATDQSGVDRYCSPASGSTTTYTCSLTPALASYTSGMTLIWRPDVACATSGVSLNVNGLGAIPVVQADGVSNPSSCPAGSLTPLAFDGTSFRITGSGNQSSSGGSGSGQSSGGAGISRGPYASAPACGSTAFEYRATDSPLVLNCNGTTGQWFLKDAPVTPAFAAQWTWINQSGATMTTQGGSVILTGTGSSGVNIQALAIPTPAAPYSATACFVGMLPAFQFAGAGMFLSQGTSASSPNITIGSAFNSGAPGTTGVYTQPSFTQGGSQYSGYAFQPPIAPPGTQTCFTISDNGINRKFWYSADGLTRLLVLSTGDEDYLSADHIGIYVDSALSSQPVAMILYSFTVVAESL